jgi:hypothetical protein
MSFWRFHSITQLAFYLSKIVLRKIKLIFWPILQFARHFSVENFSADFTEFLVKVLQQKLLAGIW